MSYAFSAIFFQTIYNVTILFLLNCHTNNFISIRSR
uniref:Uncharacterized protein n=1 Tax=Arundo donax TaxID=35708 RepID=A0A0A9FYB9_ARUDO